MRFAFPAAKLILAGLVVVVGRAVPTWDTGPGMVSAGPLPAWASTATPPAGEEEPTGDFKLKVDVNLVLVEATVRDERGGIVDGLTRADFAIFENGALQTLTHFSQDELPLAVAIVVDASGSVAPVMGKLREAALETLSLLKPEDQVALFEFDSEPRLLEVLTPNRHHIAESIAAIAGGSGGTNINDALLAAARYLGSESPQRRHAIVLVSDNIATYRSQASRNDVVRGSIETETVIYSIRITTSRVSRTPLLPDILAGTAFVDKMAYETGGEVFEAYDGRSIRTALGAVISRLKKRYTLGYSSTNRHQDGKFREITVRLSEGSPAASRHYRIFARRGYYAPLPGANLTRK